MGPLLSHQNHAEATKTAPISKNQAKKAQKAAKNESWRNAVQEFKDQCLDDAYVNYPVRSKTIQGASLYPAASENLKTLLPGSHKHLGGAYDPTDGCIYGVPANSRAVLVLFPVGDTYEMRCIPLPDSVAGTNYKWLRGIFAHGYLWAIPAWADSVLCVDVDAYWGRREQKGDIVQLLPLPEDHPKGMRWQWHGAGINHEQTAIYCIPANARKVLKVSLLTKKTSLIPITFEKEKYPNFDIELANKWYGGITGDDNCVYGVPYRSCAVLRIECKNDSASLIGPDYGVAGYNWHGGIKRNGKIFAHPSHSLNTVLVIDTKEGVDERCSERPIQRAPYDNDDRQTYKWLGGSVGVDGNIYCPACDTSAVLRIDTITEQCTTYGFAGRDKNKWQGGILGRDGCIYCIPASGKQILRIFTGKITEGEKPIQLIGDLPDHKDKWQGGHAGLDGSLYFIPENGYRVLKVTPPPQEPQLVDGKLPEGDVTVEFM